MNKEIKEKLDEILDMQSVIVQMNLFVLEYISGDDERRERIKELIAPISAGMSVYLDVLEHRNANA
ncbi:MAG: hypothetical protein IKZ88_07140 [Neisseriaceae bacterium]|nr:hypothetical protein [Neisseriaceae bacterium]